jgi:alkylation response protein AidB-like acyl-CoA dehydrogenase
MDFDLSNEQVMLRDAVERFVRERHAFAERPARLAARESSHRALWREFAHMGWLALPFAEEQGGLGGGMVDAMLLMQAFGCGLVGSAYVSGVIHAGELLSRAPRAASNAAWVDALASEVASGMQFVCVAHTEHTARYEQSHVTTRAEQLGTQWILHGVKHVVRDADHAQTIIVSARTRGAVADQDGITLFVIDPNATGVTRSDRPSVDAGVVSTIALNGVVVDDAHILGELHAGFSLLEDASDAACVALGAEALGIMDALYTETLNYVRQRCQFDQLIGSFQVVQHRLVDMFMALEQTRSLVYHAAIRFDEARATANVQTTPAITTIVQKAASALKVQVGRAGRFISQESVQLHGAMGMTDELIVGHYFKRLLAIDAEFGNVDAHLARFATLSARAEARDSTASRALTE